MQALNQKERKKSILRFVLFFSILVILTILIISNLFSFKGELSDRQKMMLVRYNKFMMAEEAFVNKSKELDSLIIQLKPGSSVLLEGPEIAKKNDFSSLVEKDSSFKLLNKQIEQVFKHYLDLKLQFINEAGDEDGKNKVIDELNGKLKDKEAYIQALLNSMAVNGQVPPQE